LRLDGPELRAFDHETAMAHVLRSPEHHTYWLEDVHSLERYGPVEAAGLDEASLGPTVQLVNLNLATLQYLMSFPAPIFDLFREEALLRVFRGQGFASHVDSVNNCATMTFSVFPDTQTW
jgi:hypothetical protein